MTPQEKDLILGVFDRLAHVGAAGRDAEAEALINQRIVQQPDAVYGLVQAVIIQEMTLNQAQQHIAELEKQLAQARNAAQPAAGGSSFLGGAAGGYGSVPNTGARWGAQQAAPQPQPQYAAPPQPQYAPQPQQFAPQPFAQPSAGGGFLRSAATMAAGVAGGTLLAEGISSLFGGHRGFGGGFGGSPWGGGQPTEVVENVTTVNNYYDGQGQGGQNAGWEGDAADSVYQDASYDDGNSFDDSGFDDSQDV